ncbi:MAG: FprA family A-type flavoprotein [Ruminococcus sp.]|nr:FprA family A-type flavoprotein [Ruminococcus sp.]
MNKIKENVYYIGVNDHLLDLFEGQYIVPNGMAYNSYIIADEKTAILDTVDVKFGDKWLENIKEVLGDKSPDYLIIQHMEPDHSACIGDFTAKYPDTTIVGNTKTFDMLRAFFPDLTLSNTLVVNDSEKLSLGSRELTFVTAPMVHWPEVMMTYDSCDKIFFSADAFGKFGALDVEEDWACEARRYYFGIVGKYGMQVQALFKKIANLDIQTICPLHGPILTENLGYYLDLYNTWSSYGVESEGIFIAYTSVYGNTKKAAELLRDKLIEKGCPKVAIADLAREDMAEAVEDGFRYGKIVLATTTYNGEMFPFMNQYVDALVERNYQNRTIGIIENGSWAAMAAKRIKAKFENSKNITFTNITVSIKSALKPENIAQINDLADELLK